MSHEDTHIVPMPEMLALRRKAHWFLQGGGGPKTCERA
jgi:hypothetical protein